MSIYKKFKTLWNSIFTKSNNVDLSKEELLKLTGQPDVEFKEKLGASEDPLKPYFHRYAFNPESYNFLERKYKEEGRPFSPEDYKKIFTSHISIKSFCNEKKIVFLSKIWEDAQTINKILEPLKQLKISYTLDLTGGSVRDFVLNNADKIKDLDFMVSIQETVPNLIEQNIFSKDELKKVSWEEASTIEDYKSKLLQLCFNRSKDNIKVFAHKKREIPVGQDNYGSDIFRKDRLISVIKLEGKKTHYPIDILLTDFVKPAFLKDFDFDLCKASFCFVNPHVKKDFPKNATHLISRFVADLDFWADVHNNTNTYNTNERLPYHIDRSFDDHYPRIMEKYPNSKLLITGKGDHREYLETKMFAKELGESLSVKDSVKSKKMKI